MSTITGPWPPSQLPTERAKHGEPLLADVVRVPAANVALYEAHTMGKDTVGTTPSTTPLNGAGTRGHDHSGGEFGRPLFRSIYTTSLDDGGNVSSNIVSSGERPGRVIISGDAGDDVVAQMNQPLFVWVPPCPAGGAYDNVAVYCVIKHDSTSLDAADDLKIRLRNEFPGYQRSCVFDLSETSTSAQRVGTSGQTERLELLPGIVNPVRVEYELDLAASPSGSRSATIDILQIEIGVYES